MRKNKSLILIYLCILTISSLLFFNQNIYAENIKQFEEYNLELNLKTDYEYRLLEYSFITEDNSSTFNKHTANFVYINQQGNWNDSSVSQIGIFGSIVEIIQIGNKNKADIKQHANNTTAEVFQFGDNHDLSVEQWGSQGKIYVIQSGNNLENKEVKIIQF